MNPCPSASRCGCALKKNWSSNPGGGHGASSVRVEHPHDDPGRDDGAQRQPEAPTRGVRRVRGGRRARPLLRADRRHGVHPSRARPFVQWTRDGDPERGRGRGGRLTRPSLAVDLSPLRDSRDLRLLVGGNIVSGLGTQAALVALPVPALHADRLGLPDRPARRRRARAARRHGARGRRAGRPPRPAPPAAPRPGRPRGLRRGAGAAGLRGRPAARGALRARRPAGGLRRGPERRPVGHRPEPRRARAPAPGAGAELRALPADARRGARARRPAHRRARRGLGLRRRRRELLRPRRRRPGDVAAAAADRAGGDLGAARGALDRRGPAVRPRRAGAHGLLRDRPAGHDLRDAARAVPGARGRRLRRRARRAPGCSTPRSRPGRRSPP